MKFSLLLFSLIVILFSPPIFSSSDDTTVKSQLTDAQIKEKIESLNGYQDAIQKLKTKLKNTNCESNEDECASIRNQLTRAQSSYNIYKATFEFNNEQSNTCTKNSDELKDLKKEASEDCKKSNFSLKVCYDTSVKCVASGKNKKSCPIEEFEKYKSSEKGLVEAEKKIENFGDEVSQLQSDLIEATNDLNNLNGNIQQAIINKEILSEQLKQEAKRSNDQQLERYIKYQQQIQQFDYQIQDQENAIAQLTIDTNQALQALDVKCDDRALVRYTNGQAACLKNVQQKVKRGTYKCKGFGCLYSAGPCSIKYAKKWKDFYRKECKAELTNNAEANKLRQTKITGIQRLRQQINKIKDGKAQLKLAYDRSVTSRTENQKREENNYNLKMREQDTKIQLARQNAQTKSDEIQMLRNKIQVAQQTKATNEKKLLELSEKLDETEDKGIKLGIDLEKINEVKSSFSSIRNYKDAEDEFANLCCKDNISDNLQACKNVGIVNAESKSKVTGKVFGSSSGN